MLIKKGSQLVCKSSEDIAYDKGYFQAIKNIKIFMLETFGGDDGSGNLNKIYGYLDKLEKNNE